MSFYEYLLATGKEIMADMIRQDPSAIPPGPRRMAGQVAVALSEAVQLGGREHRRDAYLLPLAAGAPQAPEINQYARAGQRRAQTPVACDPDISESGELFAADEGAGGRNPRRLDRTAPLPEHGTASGAQETETGECGVNNLEYDWIYKGGEISETQIAELDAHNSVHAPAYSRSISD